MTELEEKLLAALKRCIPWVGRLIADNGHMNSVAPNDAIGALEQAEAAVAEAELPLPIITISISEEETPSKKSLKWLLDILDRRAKNEP